MNRRMSPSTGSGRATWLVIAAAALAGCSGENQEPQSADELFARVKSANYTSWRRAPTLPERQPSYTAHAGAVDVYVNPVIAGAISDPNRMVPRAGLSPAWPKGSIVVKEGYSGAKLSIVAVMERRSDADDGWFFAEYNAEGKVLFSGRPAICVDCHKARVAYSDSLFSVEQPR